MVLRVDESDPRCPFVAGMEDVSIDEVVRLRECVLTNKPYPLLSFRNGPRREYPASISKKEIKSRVFHEGQLACRVVNILINKNKAKPHAGVIRHLYANESDTTTTADQDDGFIIIDGDNGNGSLARRDRRDRYVFGDVFCGAGGASQGAKQAGLDIMWGMDNDNDAITAYQKNYPGALPFRCNTHDFPPRGHSNEELKVDILHLSPPCCFFSPAQ
jgi:DNA (cytosine-5)-methyltransferase 1